MEEFRSLFDQIIPVVSHLEVFLPQKPLLAKNIGHAIKGPQHHLWKENLFVQYDKEIVSTYYQPQLTIQSLPKIDKLLISLISPGIDQVDLSDAWKFVDRNCYNGSSVSQWAHIDALITWLTINDIRRCCLRLISPPAVGMLCAMWNVGPANVPVMGFQDR